MIKRYHGTYQISNVRPNTIGLCKFKVLTVYTVVFESLIDVRSSGIRVSYGVINYSKLETLKSGSGRLLDDLEDKLV